MLQVNGDLWKTAAFIDAVTLPKIAPSLGGVESLIEQPTVISYWDQVRAGAACLGGWRVNGVWGCLVCAFLPGVQVDMMCCRFLAILEG